MNIIRKIRHQKNISIGEMADFLEMPFVVYLYYESIDIKLMQCDTLFDLCNRLNIDYHILL